MPTPIHPEESVCIFVFPPSLTFYLDEPSTHKQILSIHNPYGYHLKFRVLCTDTTKYTVSESQGYIKPLNAQDLVVRHKAVLPENVGVADTIRVQLFATSPPRSLGMKEISVTLQANRPEPAMVQFAAADTERFQQLHSEASLSGLLRQRRDINREDGRSSSSHVVHIAVSVVVALFCIIVLSLPSEEEMNARLPFSLHFSETVKLIAAYILGCMSTLFLRS